MKKRTRVTTLIFMAVIIVVIAVYDTAVAVNGIAGDTISEVTLDWAHRRPISVLCLGLGLGIILGHLFWPQKATTLPEATDANRRT